MSRKQNQNGIFGLLWNFFSSVSLTIVTLITLAVASIIGTLIPQNGNPEFYLHKYGEVLYNVFSAFNIFDMYHSLWFRALVVTLVINIIVCSIDKLSATWKIIFPGKPVFRKNKLQSGAGTARFDTPPPPDRLIVSYQTLLNKRYRATRLEESENGFLLFAEKGRETRLGVYIVHLSIILLLIGSLVGSMFGFDGSVNIAEGESTDQVLLLDGQHTIKLDFSIRCDDFSVHFYDSGAPKEFRSALTLLRNNKPILTKDIIVNDPLRYGGINIFQSSYGKLPPRQATLVFQDRKTGKELHRQSVSIGEKLTLPNQAGEFVLRNYNPKFRMGGRSLGEAFTGTLKLPDNRLVDVLIPYPFPRVDFSKPESRRQIDMFQTSASGIRPEQATVQVTSNATGMAYTLDMAVGETQSLPEGLGRFTLDRFQQDYQFKGHLIGEAYVGTFQGANGSAQEIVMPIRFSQFDRMRKGKLIFSIADPPSGSSDSGLIVSVADYQDHYYTGLQVTRDPGVWVVYAGFIMMILGCYITFFLSHQQVCVEAVREKGQTRVRVFGTANKNKINMKKQVETLSARLEKIS